MKQIALDIGLASGPTLASFFAGPNEAALKHLQLWAGSPTRSPVPTYLWGATGSGKTHLLKAVREALREQGATAGWMDASVLEPLFRAAGDDGELEHFVGVVDDLFEGQQDLVGIDGFDEVIGYL